MENAIKDMGKDNLGLAILTTLFRVLFLILILFKTFSFDIIKKDYFFKLNFQLCHKGFTLKLKEKDQDFFPLIKEALKVNLFFQNLFAFLLILKTKKSKKLL